jgi:hypothetical protein
MYAGLAHSKNVGGSEKLLGAALGTGAIVGFVASRGMVMENGNLCWPTTLPSLADAGVHMGSVKSRKTSSSCPTAVVPARTFCRKKASDTSVRGDRDSSAMPVGDLRSGSLTEDGGKVGKKSSTVKG